MSKFPLRASYLFLALFLFSCANPHAITAQTSTFVLYLSDEADRLERLGRITSDQELDFQEKLLKINRALHSQADVTTLCLDKPQNRCIDDILDLIEKQLIEAENGNG